MQATSAGRYEQQRCVEGATEAKFCRSWPAPRLANRNAPITQATAPGKPISSPSMALKPAAPFVKDTAQPGIEKNPDRIENFLDHDEIPGDECRTDNTNPAPSRRDWATILEKIPIGSRISGLHPPDFPGWRNQRLIGIAQRLLAKCYARHAESSAMPAAGTHKRAAMLATRAGGGSYAACAPLSGQLGPASNHASNHAPHSFVDWNCRTCRYLKHRDPCVSAQSQCA